MSEQVMISRELLERMRDLIYVLAHREDSIGQDACSVGGHFPELLAQPASARPAGIYSADPLACPGCASGCFRCDVCYWRKRAESLDVKPAVNVSDVNCHEAQYWSPTAPVVHKDDFDRIVAALQARAVVLPSVDQVMRIVLDFQDNKRKNVTGTTNWAANLGMAVIDEVARLNGGQVDPLEWSRKHGIEEY
jgi:hypothetical protein